MQHGRCGCSELPRATAPLVLSVAQEVERFEIKVTVAEPGFFRTDLLAPHAVVYGETAITGYDAPAAIKAPWDGYHGTQTGDPAKLTASRLALDVGLLRSAMVL